METGIKWFLPQLKWDLGHWDKDLLNGKNVSFNISMDGCRY